MNWSHREEPGMDSHPRAVRIDDMVYHPIDDTEVSELVEWYEYENEVPLEKNDHREYMTREHCPRCRTNVRLGDWSMFALIEDGEALCVQCEEEIER